MKRTTLALLILSASMYVAATTSLQPEAAAWPPYLKEWQQLYPESTLPQRMQATFGNSCVLCHSPVGLPEPGNCYRDDLANLLDEGKDILDALLIADQLDSDGDGLTNGEQILMRRADDPNQIGYNPGLSGCYGYDACSDDPSVPWTGIAESPDAHTVLGDLTCSGAIDVFDLLQLLSAWGMCPDVAYACIADLNGDGAVDVIDLLILLGNWG